MFPLLIFLVVIALIIFYFVALYNGLVKNKNLVEETWSTISILQKKRYNLIPNLVETVKGYAKHEKETLENVISYRNNAVNAAGVANKQVAEQNLNRALVNLFAVTENYPDLKANVNFQQFHAELIDIENDIETARRQYNTAVRQYNNSTEVFPSNFIANTYQFKKAEYFELDSSTEKAVPEVKF